jgi:DNA-binding NarL/FixJ family response regulator
MMTEIEKQISAIAAQLARIADTLSELLKAAKPAEPQADTARPDEVKVKPATTRRRWTLPEIRQAVELRKQGAPYGRIAAELGRTEKAVQHQLEPFNVKPQADSLRLKL